MLGELRRERSRVRLEVDERLLFAHVIELLEVAPNAGPPTATPRERPRARFPALPHPPAR